MQSKLPLTVLISHAHDEHPLAEAWKKLLERISMGLIDPWYSSDSQFKGGMQIAAEWRETLRNKLEKSQYVISILSPHSRDRPWILWECGVMSGISSQKRKHDDGEQRGYGAVIPVLYTMKADELANPLSSFNAYDGGDLESVRQVCARLTQEAGFPSPQPQDWDPALKDYLAAIIAHRPRRARTEEEMRLWRTRIEQLVQYGRTCEVLSLRERMYASFDKAFKPVDIVLHDLLSRILLDHGHYAQALEEISYAMMLCDSDVDLLHRHALACAHSYDLETALNIVKQLKKIDISLANNQKIASLEGEIYLRRYRMEKNSSDLEAASAAYQRALNTAYEARKKPPLCFWTDFSIGEILFGQGDVENALNEYRRGMQRQPAPTNRDRESAMRSIRLMAELRGLADDVVARFSEVLDWSFQAGKCD